MRPQTFRNGSGGVRIRFGVAECSLGSMLVASTDKGVCAIFLGDNPAALVRDLQARFPKAALVGGGHEFETLIQRVIGFVESAASSWDLPLDVRGTLFQQKVWNALCQIPSGKTASYAEIAAYIGAPKSVRAVAGACAANPVAIVVPCHRVVRTDGSLSGYRWGVERKRALLQKESS